jgi:phosphopantothenoylcysteine decarboxylase
MSAFHHCIATDLRKSGHFSKGVCQEFWTWADLLLIAPLSANTLAKMAHGICDNFLCCIARAWSKEKPIVLAPAMNTEMWIDPITEEHFTALRRRFPKLAIVAPESGLLACGDTGVGAMARIERIVEAVGKNLSMQHR